MPKSYFLSFFRLFWAYFGVCSVFSSCRGSRCSQTKSARTHTHTHTHTHTVTMEQREITKSCHLMSQQTWQLQVLMCSQMPNFLGRSAVVIVVGPSDPSPDASSNPQMTCQGPAPPMSMRQLTLPASLPRGGQISEKIRGGGGENFEFSGAPLKLTPFFPKVHRHIFYSRTGAIPGRHTPTTLSLQS